MKFMLPIVFQISKFKNPAIWFAKSIFAFNLRTRFFPDMQFQQNHKGHNGGWFKPKRSTHQCTIFFLQNPKNPILGVILVIIPKIRFFLKTLALSVFYPLRHTKRSFQKILSCFGENAFTYWHTDIMTAMKS